jgi:hypothetical protein
MHGPTRSVVLRLLVSTAVGLAMAWTTFVSAYRTMRTATPYADRHRVAFVNIGRIKYILEKTHKEKGRFPGSLAELKDPLDEYLSPDRPGEYFDPWKHPYEYRSDGQSYTLRSLGLDGKPGGAGLARDVDARDLIVDQNGAIEFPSYRNSLGPTLWQYAFLETTGFVKITCALAGVFTAVACFMTLADRRLGLVRMLGNLFGTLLMCVVVTWFITILHTPSHH